MFASLCLLQKESTCLFFSNFVTCVPPLVNFWRANYSLPLFQAVPPFSLRDLTPFQTSCVDSAWQQEAIAISLSVASFAADSVGGVGSQGGVGPLGEVYNPHLHFPGYTTHQHLGVNGVYFPACAIAHCSHLEQ